MKKRNPSTFSREPERVKSCQAVKLEIDSLYFCEKIPRILEVDYYEGLMTKGKEAINLESSTQVESFLKSIFNAEMRQDIVTGQSLH